MRKQNREAFTAVLKAIAAEDVSVQIGDKIVGKASLIQQTRPTDWRMFFSEDFQIRFTVYAIHNIILRGCNMPIIVLKTRRLVSLSSGGKNE